MDTTVSKSKFKAHALEYFRLVQSGSTLIVTDRGRPVARIVPIRQSAEDTLSKLRGTLVKYSDPLEPVSLEDWETLP